LAVRASTHQPEQFQAELMDNITKALLRTPSPPCLLRAPTGSGKTFVMGQVLQRVGRSARAVVLVCALCDAGGANAGFAVAARVRPVARAVFAGRNQDLGAGTVLISTAQGVARAQWRTKGYDADADDDVRTLAALVARACQGLADWPGGG
jgi:superfamily II DNA or RNA helicase